MSVYPFSIDSDADIIRIDNNITQLGGEAINQLRDSMFAVQGELGVRPSGSKSTVALRLDESLNPDGSIKASALTSVGLATLPIDDTQVASTAGIKEYKIALDHTTSDLYTLILSNTALLTSLTSFANAVDSDLSTHIGGGAILSDGSDGRHVASHIDLNDVASDVRDPSFTWTGLLDKNGAARTATHVAGALLEINDEFTSHQNSMSGAHFAAGISLNTTNFQVIPQTANDVQKFADYIDDFDVVTIRNHRQTDHSNGIRPTARSTGNALPDGYGWQNVVPSTTVSTYLVRSPETSPVDNISTGDDIVKFVPDNAGFIFDSQFVGVKIGDIIRINYANGTEASYPVESIRFIPGTEWVVRLNGVNLADTDVALARIDRPNVDRSTAGVLAVAAANATPTGSFNNILQSVVVGHPHGASTVGLGFDANQLDKDHYKLYLEMYPTGDPNDRVITLPFIDVTGDAGVSPGGYTLDSVISVTNNKLREIGYNYRLIAFAYNGDFGIMMADAYNNASFSITSGVNSGGVVAEGAFTENVIGDSTDGLDALGLGQNHADVASPFFINTYSSSDAAILPTKVIVPRKLRNYYVDGVKRDTFADTWMANSDGYWDGYISARVTVGAFTVETTYAVELDLEEAGLRPGKTIVIQPKVAFTDTLYNDYDYGRFIIKSINFDACPPGGAALTLITVISGIHGTGIPFAPSAEPTLAVKLYFGEDSVSFNNQNVIDVASPGIYHRLHEIFISNAARTFAHERARMTVQAQTTELLATENWHIENVSPKLRGYRDGTVSIFNKWIRFYLLTYTASTGEYTGYIGQRNPSTSAISNVGPITTGRKNVPTRFYDETNLDFIELVFTETAINNVGSTLIITTAVARYVDIELFQSFQTNDEMFLLATAEVNWSPQGGQDVVQRVKDRREVGSIDEEDFTNAAKDFISAGDRHLHENGIIKGLDFDIINPLDNRELFYKGGVALVNGTIVSVNNLSVTIPQVTKDTAVTGDVDWAICVNENGSLEPIVITATKEEFFARDPNVPNNTYYVPSVTFVELIENRKDLTPITVVTATIASFTITDGNLLDVRRFVDDGKKRELVYSPSDFAGTFHTPAALRNWVNQYGSSNQLKVKVRGTFSLTSFLDFTAFTSPVLLEGDGAVFIFQSNIGISIGSNVSLKDITFHYALDSTTPPTYTNVNNIINVGNGCIFNGITTDLTNVTIEGCTFISDEKNQRPPFINIRKNNDDEINNLKIINNSFTSDPGAQPRVQAAIAIVHNDAAGTIPARIVDSLISGNRCTLDEGIYITSDSLVRGFVAVGTQIINNSCGIIGYSTSSSPQTVTARRHNGLSIKDNTCGLIVMVDEEGTGVDSTTVTDYPTGNVIISGNYCNYIDIRVTPGDSDDVDFAFTSVINNVLQANATTLKDIVLSSAGAMASDTALSVRGNGLAPLDNERGALISGNSINKSTDGTSTFEYDTGILVSTSGTITDNIIRGIADSGIGIRAISPNGAVVPAANVDFLINSNKIYKGANDVTAFISMNVFDGKEITALVIDNYFDSPFIAGTDTNVIEYPVERDGISAIRNINQTEVIEISWAASSAFLISDAGSTLSFGPANFTGTSFITGDVVGASADATSEISFINVAAKNDSSIFYWHIPADTILPNGVEIIDFTATASVNINPDQASVFDISIQRGNGWGVGVLQSETVGTGAGVTVTIGGGDEVLSLSDIGGFPNNTYTTGRSSHGRVLVEVKCTLEHSTGDLVKMRVKDIIITYRW